MRLFLALTFDAHLQRDIAEATRAMREAVPSLAWVVATRLHLTLKFLGDVDEGVVPRVREVAHAALRGARAHDVVVGGIGAFPNLERPRVVWMGMHDTAPLVSIAGSLDRAVAALGVPEETRPFRPHVTLARVKAPLAPAQANMLTQRASEIRVRVRVPVREVVLMHSTLGAGARYDALATFPLEAN